MRVPDERPIPSGRINPLRRTKPTKQHIGLLRWLAGLPHIQERTWYGFGTTMTNGRPPQPIFDDSELDCFLFLESVVGRDNTVHEKLVLDGDPTAVLWVVPITEAECQFIIEESIQEFLDIARPQEAPVHPGREAAVVCEGEEVESGIGYRTYMSHRTYRRRRRLADYFRQRRRQIDVTESK